MIGIYRPGGSVLHRAPAGAKLAGLAAGATALLLARSVVAVEAAMAVLVALTLLARLPPSAVCSQLRPLRLVLVLVATFQLLTAGWRAAVVVSGTMAAAVTAAGLVTLTTRVSDLVDVLTRMLRPLGRVGVDPSRVGLLLALTLRSIAVLDDVRREVADARRARGLERSARALLVPMVVRTVRHADRLGEALAARGLDDD